MRKPTLYLDVVGTLILEKGGEMAVAAGARRFVEAIQPQFRVVLLTELEEHQALRVARALGLERARYHPYRRALGKTSAINLDSDFFWIDDDPEPSDLLRLSDERRSNRLIPVNRREGVSETTLKKLLEVFHETREPLTQRQSS